jgi:4-hydroxyphenylpyruvate dioxygenase-like putative hemolysin
MGALFERLGFRAIARHRHKDVVLYRQGGINFIVNAEPDSFAQRFARLHGPSICAIAFRVLVEVPVHRRELAMRRRSVSRSTSATPSWRRLAHRRAGSTMRSGPFSAPGS